MKVVKVEAKVLSVPNPSKAYWGFKAWGEDYAVSESAKGRLDRTYPLRWRMRHYWTSTISTCIVKITTDDGIVGYGESKAVLVPQAIKAYLEGYLAKLIVGEDPFFVRVLWDRMQASMRGRGHTQGFHQEVAAGIDIALWDIIGKACGRPICDLLGGKYRDKVRVYYSGLPGIHDPTNAEESRRLSASIREVVSKGFNAVKIAIGFGFQADLRSVEIVRENTDSEFLILVDALGSYDYTQAVSLSRMLAEKGVGWLEAPLRTDDFEGYVRLGQNSPMYITNDLVWTTELVRDMLSDGGRIIFQPEAIKVGISECARIAALADTFNCPYAPHVSVGSAIEFAATAHLAASAPNFIISEYWADDNPLGNNLLKEPLVLDNGALIVPDRPGLGIEFEPKRLEAVELSGSEGKVMGINP